MDLSPTAASDTQDTVRKRIRRYYCQNCDTNLGKSAYYEHLPSCRKSIRLIEDPASTINPSEEDSRSDSSFQLSMFKEDDGPAAHAASFANSDEQEDCFTPEGFTHEEQLSDEGDMSPEWSSDVSEPEDDVMDEFEGDPIWVDSEDEDEQDELWHQSTMNLRMPSAVRLLILFLLTWQSLFHVSNAGIGALILFIYNFLHFLSSLSHSNLIQEIAACCPRSLYAARKIVGLSDDKFVKYVVCVKCDSIYTYEQCKESAISSTSSRSKKCWYVQYPNHPMRRYRVQCGALLLNSIQSRTGKFFLYAKKVFCYRSITESLADLYNREGFIDQCQLWRSRLVPEAFMGDVYDGKLWKDFVDIDGKVFVDDLNSLMMFLNVDWFQPFTHLTDSVGAMYLSIVNLPRSERYKMENIILVGIIPGPKEPKLTMNSFLSHLVDELKELWQGVNINVKSSNVRVRVALTGICCDLPAVRKVCGFSSFSACLGCSKCLCHFPSSSFQDKLDYSDYDRQQWPLRSLSAHRENADKFVMSRTKAQQNQIVREHGVRSSLLLQLPYFDPIRYHVVDPMHNLLLGTAKRMMSIWINNGILSNKSLEVIEKRVSAIHTPKHIGRIPTKISSGFAGFTADQWRNWTIVFSSIALKGLLPNQHYINWILFVKACSLLCTRIIRRTTITSADLYLLEFCKGFQRIYGSNECTPNMHMHLHIKDSLLDYGPVYSFWCFPFERYNGILGSYHTNSRKIEPQIMSKFLNDQQARILKLPEDLAHFKEVLPYKQNLGSLKEASCTGSLILNLFELSSPCQPHTLDFSLSDIEQLIPPIRECVMTADLHNRLSKVYAQLYPEHRIHQVQRTYLHSKRASIGGELFVAGTFNKRQSVISAYWPGRGYEVSSFDAGLKRVGVIDFFLRHTVLLQLQGQDNATVTVRKVHILCYVHWYQYHPRYDWFGSSAIVCTKQTEVEDACCFIPLKRVSNRCAAGELVIDFGPVYGSETVLVTVPLPISYSL